MLLRAMLPAGFMPAVDASGGPTLVLCTTQGAQRVSLDALTKSAPRATHAQHCPFGFALSMAAGIAATPASTSIAIRDDAPIIPTRGQAFTGARKSHSARGPPSALA